MMRVATTTNDENDGTRCEIERRKEHTYNNYFFFLSLATRATRAHDGVWAVRVTILEKKEATFLRLPSHHQDYCESV